MIYVTHDYKTKEFEDENAARLYIEAEMKKQNLAYQKVFDKNDDGVQIIVFQYYTLYMEAFIIHKQFDLRDRRLS